MTAASALEATQYSASVFAYISGLQACCVELNDLSM